MDKKEKGKKDVPVQTFDELRKIIGDFHNVGTERIQTPTGDYYNGFSIEAIEIEAIMDYLRKNEKDTNRVFFAFAYHQNAAHGLPAGSYSLVASPMILDEAANQYVIPYSDISQGPVTNFDYCKPCPDLCPKFLDFNGNLIDIRDL